MAMFNTQVSKFRNVVCQEPKVQDMDGSGGSRLLAENRATSRPMGSGWPLEWREVVDPSRCWILTSRGAWSLYSLCMAIRGLLWTRDFNPFNDDQLVSCAEDTSIKLWDIPAGGLTANIDAPTSTVGDTPAR